MPSQQNCLPSRKATVGSLATGALSAALPHSRSEVVERINKCLAHADHANVDEMRQNLQSRWLQKQCKNTTSLKPKSWKTRMMPASRTRWLEHCQYWTTNAAPTSCFRDLVVDLEDAISTFVDCKAFSSQYFISIK